jgi:hypothetical protein
MECVSSLYVWFSASGEWPSGIKETVNSAKYVQNIEQSYPQSATAITFRFLILLGHFMLQVSYRK